jgi:uncharacterized membrane protein YjgN (DUF898 family)
MSNLPANVPLPSESATVSSSAMPMALPSDPAPEMIRRQPFYFSGTGREYFGIWIVNVLLTILTLGIYSAWAKVRSTRYFYDNTHVAGASFDYHGNPVTILKGRLIALGMLLAYNFSFNLSSVLGVFTLLVVMVATPWLVWKSLQFKLHNSSYCGIRFGFRGSVEGAYHAYMKMPAIAVLTLGFGIPFAQHRVNLFQHGQSRLGDRYFNFTASVAQFYRMAGIALAIGVLFSIPFAILASVGSVSVLGLLKPDGPMNSPDADWSAWSIGVVFAFYLLMFTVVTVFRCLQQNLVWSHTQLGNHAFAYRLQWHRVLWIHLSNLVAIVCTLGLFTPFAKIRMLKYRLQCMTLIANGSIDDFVAQAYFPMNAVGEGAADLMGFDVSL